MSLQRNEKETIEQIFSSSTFQTEKNLLNVKNLYKQLYELNQNSCNKSSLLLSKTKKIVSYTDFIALRNSKL